MSFTVSLRRCPDYTPETVTAAVTKVLAPLGGLTAFIRPGQRVLIKLNLLGSYPPEAAVTTHPALARAVIQAVQAIGATPIIGDSPGGVNTTAVYQALLRKTGMQQVIDDTGCAVVNFDEAITEISSDKARTFKKFPVVTAPLEADAVIALPKLKTHQMASLTGAVKLLYGYLPGLTKVKYHLHAGKDVMRFAELLLDIYETLPPTLYLMDAVVAMEGHGPSHGDPRQVGLLLASTDGPALDFIAAHLINLNPLRVPTIREAIRRGIGPKELAEITLYGEALAAVRIPDFRHAETGGAAMLPPWLAQAADWLFSPRPVIDRATCLKCGKCAQVCPPGAIHYAPGILPRIDYGPCIRCYCCHELCPHGAVRVQPARIRLPGLR